VEDIGRGGKAGNNIEYTIDKLHAFIIVTIGLIDPNKGLNPAKCEGKNGGSTEE
jgi:hypothetical protein